MQAVRLSASHRLLLSWLKRLVKYYFAYKILRVWFPRKVKSVKGATALVTGAAGGLGACICKDLAKRGAANLVLWDINQEAMNSLALDLKSGQYPGLKNVSTQKVNLAERDEIYKASATALDNVGGRMDVVINNAGLVSGGNFVDTADQKIELTMKVNAMAHMYITKAFLPGMIKNSGGPSAAFINIASFASFMGAAQMVDYAASKFAARGFSEALGAELKQMGLWEKCKISCICPSHIDTALFKGFHILGAIPMSAKFVAQKVVDAYECERELVVLPRHISPGVALIGILQSLCHFNFPLAQPKKSPLADFDRTQCDAIFKKIDS